MTSYFSSWIYAPFPVFLAGIVTVIALYGLGMRLISLTGIPFPMPWKAVVGLLAGIQFFSLVIQFIAMAEIASEAVLLVVWTVMVVYGLTKVAGEIFMCSVSPGAGSWKRINPLMPLVLVAVITNLLAAMAPSTKIDELYYHMLLPARIVHDHALLFYKMPWEAAILPHMVYPFSLAPLHALGYPDAGNVVSWALSVVLLWFGWRLVTVHPQQRVIDNLLLLSLMTGIHPVIWYVTGGSFAMGDLATAACVVAVISSDGLLRQISAKHFMGMISFLVLCSVSSKISMAPLGLELLVVAFFRIPGQKSAWNRLTGVMGWMILPWVIFFFPMAIWTLIHSGSPFGPMLAGFMNLPSVYDVSSVRALLLFDRISNIPGLTAALKSLLIYLSPLIWAVVVLFFMNRQTPLNIRLTAFVLLFVQTLVIFLFLFFDPRFFGGLIQGLLISFILYDQKNRMTLLHASPKAIAFGAVLLILPWLGLQVFYARQFFPVSLGFEDKEKFCRENIAFFDDYRVIDRLLPEGAVILPSGNIRINTVCSPRAVVFGDDEIPSGKQAFLFQINGTPVSHFRGFRVGEALYVNQNAVIETYRDPFRSNHTGALRLFRLIEPD
jgi:hypothetical protein